MQVWSLDREATLRRAWQPTPVLLPGESHGLRSLLGYSPEGSKGLDVTEHERKKILYGMRLWKRERSISNSRTTNVNKRIYFSEICRCGCSVTMSFATPWAAARQAVLSFTVSQSLLKLIFIESGMPFNHLILCQILLLVFFMEQLVLSTIIELVTSLKVLLQVQMFK